MESGRRLDHADGAVGGVALVLEVGAVGQDHRGVAVEGVLQREAVLDRGGVGEGLERRARHAARDGPVDLGVEVVLAAVEAEQGAGADLDGRHRDVQLAAVEALGPLLGLTLLGRRHRLLGEGRGDPQAAAVDVLLGVAEAQQLVAHQLEHVAALAAVLALRLDLGELRQPLLRLVGLGRRDRAHVGHRAEHVLVARLEVLLGLLAVGRVEVGRVVQHARQDRRLSQGQLGRRLVEEGLRGRLDAVGAAAEVDGVEVALEHLAPCSSCAGASARGSPRGALRSRLRSWVR